MHVDRAVIINDDREMPSFPFLAEYAAGSVTCSSLGSSLLRMVLALIVVRKAEIPLVHQTLVVACH